MITIEVWDDDRDTRDIQTFSEVDVILVGRDSGCHVVLHSDFVSAHHVQISRKDGELFVHALGTNPTYLEGRQLPSDEPSTISSGNVIRVHQFRLRVIDGSPIEDDSWEAIARRVADVEREVYQATFERIDFRSATLLPDEVTTEGCDMLRGHFEPAFAEVKEDILGEAAICGAVLDRLFKRLLDRALVDGQRPADRVEIKPTSAVELPLDVFVKDPIIANVIEELVSAVRRSDREADITGKGDERLRVTEMWGALQPMVETRITRKTRETLIREELFRRVVNLAFALGPLEDLLEQPGITEVLIIGPERIYIETMGRLQRAGDRFPSPGSTRRILERAVARAGRRIDMSQPLVDAQLSDGSRLHAVIAPLSRSGDVLSIRRFPARPLTLEDLTQLGALSRTAAQFISALIACRKSIVISGGTGSGKTTLLGAMAAQVDPAQRLVLIEDTAEIQLPRTMHVVSLQTRAGNLEGKGEVTIRDLVRNSLRMRPDRVIVGECRGPEVLDMLQAMNTGHPGSLTSLHANSTSEVVSRVEVMVLQGVELPLTAIRKQIASSIDVIVHIGRDDDGRRRVQEISEVVEYDSREGEVRIAPIFQVQEVREDPSLQFTGWLPTFIEELEADGILQAEDLIA